MTRQTDELDRLIDALNAGDATPLNETDDPELADLMGAVRRVRQLRDAVSPDADWPNRAESELARDLRSGEPPAPEPREPAPELASVPPTLPVTTPRTITKRRSVSREIALMAAAIVVLVVVGGMLALIFHSQGGSDHTQVGAGGGGTPSATTESHLPMTVTASGVALQLQRVDAGDTATRFSFMLQLENVQLTAHQPFGEVLGSDPTGNVTIDGITPGPNDPYETESDGVHDSHPIISFTLDYQSPFPVDKMVTLTIQHLTVPASAATPLATPTGGSRQVDGPWTFRITPSMVENQPAPTPFASYSSYSRFGGFSIRSAQKLTSFPIIVPDPLPTSLSNGELKARNEFIAVGYGLGVPESAPANYVMFPYQAPFGDYVYLVETTNNAGVPNVSGDTATVLMPLLPDGKTQTLRIAPGTLSTPSIDGVTVTRFEVANTTTSATTIYYVWKAGGVNYSIRHLVTPSPLPPEIAGVSDSDLRQMVTSIIEQREGNKPATVTSALPQPTPAASLPLSVSANGVPVTLESITMADSGTSFEFKVRLPDTMAGTTFPGPVFFLPDDAQLVHGTDTAKPQITLRSHQPGNPDVGFSFAFAPIGKPYGAITLTIDRLRVTVVIPGTPSSQQVLQGPWVFQITPEMLTGSATPDTSPP